MYNPVKHGMRPLYIILMLIAMAAGSLTALLFQLKRHGSLAQPPETTVANDTVLRRYAAIDVGEPVLKQEVDFLLEADFNVIIIARASQRSFLSSSSGNNRSAAVLGSVRETLWNLGPGEFNRLWPTFKKCLSDWWRKRSIMSSELVDGVEFLTEKGKLYDSCAVVGNSGILLESERGELIDSHEAVIRLNNARTFGFERNVGSKTNISFVNSNILHSCARRRGCFCHPYGARVPIVVYLCQPVHFADYLVCNSSHQAPLVVTDPRFDVMCARIVKYYSMRRFVETTGKGVEEWDTAHDGENFHYSSGMQAVMLALGVCERVSLFGFGKSELARHHYHTHRLAELSLHDYEAEYDFYRDLVAGGGVVPFVADKFEFPPVVMYH